MAREIKTEPASPINSLFGKLPNLTIDTQPLARSAAQSLVPGYTAATVPAQKPGHDEPFVAQKKSPALTNSTAPETSPKPPTQKAVNAFYQPVMGSAPTSPAARGRFAALGAAPLPNKGGPAPKMGLHTLKSAPPILGQGKATPAPGQKPKPGDPAAHHQVRFTPASTNHGAGHMVETVTRNPDGTTKITQEVRSPALQNGPKPGQGYRPSMKVEASKSAPKPGASASPRIAGKVGPEIGQPQGRVTRLTSAPG